MDIWQWIVSYDLLVRKKLIYKIINASILFCSSPPSHRSPWGWASWWAGEKPAWRRVCPRTLTSARPCRRAHPSPWVPPCRRCACGRSATAPTTPLHPDNGRRHGACPERVPQTVRAAPPGPWKIQNASKQASYLHAHMQRLPQAKTHSKVHVVRRCDVGERKLKTFQAAKSFFCFFF